MMKKDELHEHLGADDGPKQKRDVGKIIRLSLSGIAGVYLVLFCIMNSTQVKVNFIVWSGTIGLIWVIIVSAILGAIAFGIVRSVLSRRRRNRR